MRRTLFYLTLLILLAIPARAAGAQEDSNLTVNEPAVQYKFGEFIQFDAKLVPPVPASEAYILFRAEGETATRIFPLNQDADGKTSFRYTFQQGIVRPYAIIHFWYRAKLQDGRELNSNTFFFQYEDNRFPWQTVENESLHVHWYAGDLAFGQTAADIAQRGLQRAQGLLNSPSTGPIDIYIYASVTDMQKALELGGKQWAGGHASPDLRVGLVSIAPSPEQGLEMDRKIPHEIAHILTYDLTGDRYERLPLWLREGIASQTELSPNPDYPRAISLAYEQQTLIPIADLGGAFPPESGRVFLAYAESQSFTRFLLDKYGQSGLLALIKSYADGLDYETGAEKALGSSLTRIESDWRVTTLGESREAQAFKNLFPYLAVLLIILLIPLGNALTYRKPKYE